MTDVSLLKIIITRGAMLLLRGLCCAPFRPTREKNSDNFRMIASRPRCMRRPVITIFEITRPFAVIRRDRKLSMFPALPIYIGMRGACLHKRQMAHCSRCFIKVPMCCAALIKRPQIKLMAENTTCPICGGYIDYLENGQWGCPEHGEMQHGQTQHSQVQHGEIEALVSLENQRCKPNRRQPIPRFIRDPTTIDLTGSSSCVSSIADVVRV